MTRALLLAVALASGSGCIPGERAFATRAVYEAPSSALHISIDARGTVPAGADLSARHETAVAVRRDGVEGTLLLDLRTEAPGVSYTLPRGDRGTRPWGPRESVATLAALLEEAGFGRVPREETTEIVRVIDGAGLGPKATVMDGQTQVLRVVRVEL